MSNGPQLIDLEGEWRLDRQIGDRHAGQVCAFAGMAAFRADAAGLTYVERGTLRMPGQPEMQAERRYLWRETAAGLCVLFDDGRPFHRIPRGLRVAASHDCPPDRYGVRYDFFAWPDWQAEWTVRGPRKDYTMRSRFRRATASDIT